MAEAALAAAAAEWLRQRWLRQRRNGYGSGGDLCLVASACVSAAFWLRQRLRRRQAALAAAVAETCVWQPRLVFLRLYG